MTRAERNLRRWVPAMWRYLNAQHFGGQLPVPRFRYVQSITVVGETCKDYAGLQWRTRKGTHMLCVVPQEVKTRLQCLSVVAHEMIHQLQLLQKSERTQREHHGRFFQHHAERLCKAGILVTVEYDAKLLTKNGLTKIRGSGKK